MGKFRLLENLFKRVASLKKGCSVYLQNNLMFTLPKQSSNTQPHPPNLRCVFNFTNMPSLNYFSSPSKKVSKKVGGSEGWGCREIMMMFFEHNEKPSASKYNNINLSGWRGVLAKIL